MGDRVFGIRGELTKPPHSPSRAAPCPAPRRRDGLAREPVQTARPCGPWGAARSEGQAWRSLLGCHPLALCGDVARALSTPGDQHLPGCV